VTSSDESRGWEHLSRIQVPGLAGRLSEFVPIRKAVSEVRGIRQVLL
jgi:hypothetical protein